MKSCPVVDLGAQVLAATWLLACAVAGCGSEAAPAARAPEAPTAVEPPAAASADAPPSDAPGSEQAPPEAEPAPPVDAPTSAAEKDPNAPREVKYVVTPEGLKIEVAGVRFLVNAEAKQIAQGWGAKITVKAEATDGREHVLLNPENGPLALSAAVLKKGRTEAERIADSRDGEGELALKPGGPLSFSRAFPAKGGRVLAIGETLDMQVALWGLGETKDDRRPVKQFFQVMMKVDKGKPKAIVTPPASASQ